MEHQNHLRPRSNLDQDQRQNLQQEQDRRRGQVALEDNLSVEMGNDDLHFPPRQIQPREKLSGHTISKGDGHFRKSSVLAHWRHNHNGHDNH